MKNLFILDQDGLTFYQNQLPMKHRDLIDEFHALNEAVCSFAEKMIRKLTEMALAGCRGWNDTSDNELRSALIQDLKVHFEKAWKQDFSEQSMIDMANYCMMISRLAKEGPGASS